MNHPQQRWEGWRAWLAGGLSLAVHVAATTLPSPPPAAASHPPAAVQPRTTAAEREVAIELPQAEHLLATGRADAQPATVSSGQPPRPLLPGGGARLARPDQALPGRGGDPTAAQAAVNLAPRDDGVHASPSFRSRLERAQASRQRNGERRRSPEDDLVTPRPTVLTFVADTPGPRPDPRVAQLAQGLRPAKLSQRGTQRATPPAALRSADGGPRQPGPAPQHALTEPQLAVRGVEHAQPGRTLASAPARPNAVRGPDSHLADARGPAEDTLRSEQEVSALKPQRLRASPAGGPRGDGRGGQAGASSAPASGGRLGPGSVARRFGTGVGGRAYVDPADARRRGYLRHIQQRIHNSWSARDFPKAAALEGRQGYTIVAFVVAPNGSVRGVHIRRPSGVPEFDAKMLQAVLRAGPFGRPPPDLAAGFAHQHEFVVSNPAVR